MGIFRFVCLPTALLLKFVMFQSCGSEGIKKGVEYVYTAPEGSDTSQVNDIVRTMSARLNAYGLSPEQYEIDAKDMNITVRLDAQWQGPDTKIILSANGNVTFFETYDYFEIIKSIECADSIYSKQNGVTYDSLNHRRGSTIAKYWIPTSVQADLIANRNSSSAPMVPILHCLTADTAAMMKVFVDDSTAKCFPANCKFRWSPVPKDETLHQTSALIACKTGSATRVNAGKMVTATYRGISNSTSEVSFTLDKFEASQFKTFTSKNLGKVIAIDVDGIVWSYPTINATIADGNAQITGDDVFAISRFAAIMQGGPYVVPIRLVKETPFGL